jgi:hypothetical protein
MAINTVEAIQVGDTTQRIRVRGADTSTRSRPADDQRSNWLIAMGRFVAPSVTWAGNPGVTADQVARRALSRPSRIRSIPNSWSWS